MNFSCDGFYSVIGSSIWVTESALQICDGKGHQTYLLRRHMVHRGPTLRLISTTRPLRRFRARKSSNARFIVGETPGTARTSRLRFQSLMSENPQCVWTVTGVTIVMRFRQVVQFKGCSPSPRAARPKILFGDLQPTSITRDDLKLVRCKNFFASYRSAPRMATLN